MDVFFYGLAVAFGMFGLLAAALAVRQRRHPESGCSGGQGCGHHGGKIQCLDCSSRVEGQDDPA